MIQMQSILDVAMELLATDCSALAARFGLATRLE